ncbi:MAG: site-2 protease family protein [Planctomycetota bacterium]|nr:site-2 protease family protein [Planctomycetota bacterium]
MQWWLADAWNFNPAVAVSWVFWVVVSIVLHELGHGVAAIRCGDPTPRASGHMTLNPMVHIPPMAWLMFALFGFTWGLMPVQPSNFHGRYDDSKVALAGPSVNLALALLCAPLAAFWIHLTQMPATGTQPILEVDGPLRDNVRIFFTVGVMINLFGLVFNLIPIPPLDGSRIAANFSREYENFFNSERGALVGFLAFAGLFFFGGSAVWGVAMDISANLVAAILRLF